MSRRLVTMIFSRNTMLLMALTKIRNGFMSYGKKDIPNCLKRDLWTLNIATIVSRTYWTSYTCKRECAKDSHKILQIG